MKLLLSLILVVIAATVALAQQFTYRLAYAWPVGDVFPMTAVRAVEVAPLVYGEAVAGIGPGGESAWGGVGLAWNMPKWKNTLVAPIIGGGLVVRLDGEWTTAKPSGVYVCAGFRL